MYYNFRLLTAFTLTFTLPKTFVLPAWDIYTLKKYVEHLDLLPVSEASV